MSSGEFTSDTHMIFLTSTESHVLVSSRRFRGFTLSQASSVTGGIFRDSCPLLCERDRMPTSSALTDPMLDVSLGVSRGVSPCLLLALRGEVPTGGWHPLTRTLIRSWSTFSIWRIWKTKQNSEAKEMVWKGWTDQASVASFFLKLYPLSHARWVRQI